MNLRIFSLYTYWKRLVNLRPMAEEAVSCQGRLRPRPQPVPDLSARSGCTYVDLFLEYVAESSLLLWAEQILSAPPQTSPAVLSPPGPGAAGRPDCSDRRLAQPL